MLDADLARLRLEFPILAQTNYMISNSLGAMPRGVEASLHEYASAWATRGVRAWADRWWGMAEEVGDAIAPLVGAPAASVSMHENVTSAHMSALSTLPPPGPRDTIVCTAADFPSMIYLFRAQRALGYRVHVVPAEPDHTVDVSRVVDAIDDRTALVAVSHVLFRSAFILDPVPIVSRARQVGAPVMLDVYQSAGIIAVDLEALGVDFAAGGCLKWLCGGPGNAFLYTRPGVPGRTEPRFTGWMAHPAPFAFDLDTYEPLRHARRMQTGTPAIPAYYAALPGLRILRDVGVEAIRARSLMLTQRLLDKVDVAGFTTVAPRDASRRAGAVAVEVPDALQVARTLNARGVVVDYRPGVGIRIAPHFYSTEHEVDGVVEAIAGIARTRDYVTDAPGDSPVT